MAAEFFEKTYNGDRPSRSIQARAKKCEVMKNEDGNGDYDHDDHDHEVPSRNIFENNERVSSSPFQCGLTSMSPFSTSRVSTADRNINYSNKNCAQDYAPVASNAAENARAGIADLAITVSEAYRQECKIEHRGGDSDFVGNTSNYDDGQSRPSSEERGNKTELYSNSAGDLSVNQDSLDLRVKKTMTTNKNNGPVMGISPLCVDRMLETYDFQPSTYSPKGVDETDRERSYAMNSDGKNSIDFWMDLFKDPVRGIDEHEKRLIASALRDLNRQEIFIKNLTRKMENTQNALDGTTQELNHIKGIFKREKNRSTNIQILSIQEQRRLQNLYEKETRENKDLKKNVSQLEVELSTLNMSLANVHNSAKNDDTNNIKVYEDEILISKYNVQNPRNISLQAEIVELRSKLAEACAVNINDCSALNASREVEAKRNLCQVENQLEESKQKIQQVLKERQILIQNETVSKNKLKSLQTTLQETQSRYEENMKIAMKSADDVRANLKKVERERYRDRDRLNSSADVARVNNELIKVKGECARLKQKLTQVQSLVKSQKVQVVQGVDCLKEQPVNGKNDAEIDKFESDKIDRGFDDEIANYGTELKKLKDTLQMSNGESCSSDKSINQYGISSKLKKESEKRQSNESEVSKNLELSKPPVVTQKKSLDETSLIQVMATGSQSKIVQEASFVYEEGETLGEIEKLRKVNELALHARDSSYSLLIDPVSSSSWRRENGQSHPLRNKCDVSQCLEESYAVNHSTGSKVVSPNLRDTALFSSVHHSQASKKASLNDLMNQLEDSKKRLKTADEKLNGLVNEGALLSIVQNPDDSRLDGSIEFVGMEV